MIFGGSTKILINIGANYGPYVKNGETWRLLTSIFLHSGISHLIFNSIALLAFGNLIETIFGKRNFLILYLCSGISGSALSVSFNSNIISVGSSGAIFGMLGGLIIYYFFMKKVNPDYAKNNLYGLGLMLLINLFYGLSSSRIDNWAHLGGLLGGMFCSFVLINFNLNSFSLGIFNVSRIHSNYKRIYIFLSFFIWSCIIFLLVNI
jgi:rhomboid protease GluP